MIDIDLSDKYKLFRGDSLEVLSQMPSDFADCCVTSPPYYALRDYGYDGQIGLEDSPDAYIDRLVAVFREVRRVLKPSGTCWVNIGDSYWGSGSRGFDFTDSLTEKSKIQMDSKGTINLTNVPSLKGYVGGYKDKDLIGIPWMLAFALRADGWYLRQDIIWAKTNCMPESVKDRCTKSHEYIFLLTKSPKYFYDADSIRTPLAESSITRAEYGWDCDTPSAGENGIHTEKMGARFSPPNGANKRDVWYVPASGGYTDGNGAHYATYNPKLIEPCVLAGSPIGGVVLDPFNGTGTTGVVAIQNNRKYIGIDLSSEYIAMSERRLSQEAAQFSLFDI